MAEDVNPLTAQFSSRRLLPAPGEVLNAGWGQQIAENTGALARHAFYSNELAWQLPAGHFSSVNTEATVKINILTTVTDSTLNIMRHSDSEGWFGEWAMPIPVHYPYGKSYLTGLFRFKVGTHTGPGTGSDGTISIYPFVKSTPNGLSEDGETITRAEWGRKLINGTLFQNEGLVSAGTSIETTNPLDRELGLNPFISAPGSYGTAYVGFLWEQGYGTTASYADRLTVDLHNIMIYTTGTSPPGE